MQPLILATGRNKERERQTRRELFELLISDKEQARLFVRKENASQKDISDALDKMIEEESKWPIYKNELYQVQVREAEIYDPTFPPMIWLTIRRLDREPVRDWRDFQAIKNQLVGEENEAVELYPAESRVVDTANQYHLFVFKDAEIRLPFGFTSRAVTDKTISTAKQRPRHA